MKKLITLLWIFCLTGAYAQIVSPGNGSTFTFQDLASDPSGAVVATSAGYYRLSQDLTLSASDTLVIDAATKELFINNTLTITIHGCVVCAPRTDTLLVTSNISNCNGDFYDIRIDNADSCVFTDIHFEYGNNILITQSEATFERCEFSFFSEQCIKYINASPVIEHCFFHDNQQAAISSGANVTGSPVIRHNEFVRNVRNNVNQPQINLGPGIAGDTIVIEYNHIDGFAHMSGGIAIANLLNISNTVAIIRYNVVENNRYGYTQNGTNIFAIIEDNEFKNNNLETNPLNGGSGISIYGNNTTCAAKMRRNLVTGNLWGVTAIYYHALDMGTADDWGYNCIYNNANGGTSYALFNNAFSDMTAVGNFWGSNDSTDAEEVIFHYADSTIYGEVSYLPVLEIEPDILAFSVWYNNEEEAVFCFSEQGDTLLFYAECVAPPLCNVVPTITMPLWVSCSPDPSEPQCFLDHPVVYTLTTPDGRSKDWVVAVILGGDVEDFEPLLVSVSPNPATFGQIMLHNDFGQEIFVEVFTLSGQRVYANGCSAGQTVISTSAWGNGTYLLKASKGNRSRTFKVIVNN